jgi:hypothetical protein
MILSKNELPEDELSEAGRDWAERRIHVLNALAEADNDVNKTIGSVEDFALVVGDQTVKSFSSWDEFLDAFMGWLRAIQNGRKPCASFLIPHDLFGPDLVFALHDRNSDEFVLCSIQVSEFIPSISAVQDMTCYTAKETVTNSPAFTIS